VRRGGERLAPAVWALAAVTLAAHLLTTGRFGYEYFVDELYFNACADHLAWGYVDMPPLHAALTALVKATLGDSLLAIRLLPAVAGAALILLTGALARELGGGRFAQFLSALCVAVAPIFLLAYSFSSMNAWEPLLWTGCALVVVRLIDGGDPRLWLLFGLLAGVGLLNKHTMALFAIGIAAGLLATPQRSLLRSRWFWLGAAVALLIFLPNLLWNIREGFPFFELQRAIREDRRNVSLSPLQFLMQQIVMLLPVSAPVWVGGLGWLLLARDVRRYRALGIAYLVMFALLLALDGRVYYLAPAYPILFAAGAVAIELRTVARRAAWLRPAIAGLIAITGVVFAPLSLPCLPPESYVRYSRALGVAPPPIETHRLGPLPQLFADRFGWRELAGKVAEIYRRLPAAERPRTAIFGQNYGQAGAIDLYGPRLGLPRALSGHLAYHGWGPPAEDPEVLIVMDDDRPRLEEFFGEVEHAGFHEHRYSMPYQHFDIWVCRKPKVSLRQIWPQLRNLG
jgi:hypothetical protein